MMCAASVMSTGFGLMNGKGNKSFKILCSKYKFFFMRIHLSKVLQTSDLGSMLDRETPLNCNEVQVWVLIRKFQFFVLLYF